MQGVWWWDSSQSASVSTLFAVALLICVEFSSDWFLRVLTTSIEHQKRANPSLKPTLTLFCRKKCADVHPLVGECTLFTQHSCWAISWLIFQTKPAERPVSPPTTKPATAWVSEKDAGDMWRQFEQHILAVHPFQHYQMTRACHKSRQRGIVWVQLHVNGSPGVFTMTHSCQISTTMATTEGINVKRLGL